MGRGQIAVIVVGLFAWLDGCSAEEPACKAGIAATRAPFTVKCFSKHLEPELDSGSPEFGQTECRLFQVRYRAADAGCVCPDPGTTVPASVPQSIYDLIMSDKMCLPGDTCCERICICEVAQLAGAELRACQNDTTLDGGRTGAGFCYVDVEKGLGVPLEYGCQKGIRIVGLNITAILACQGTVQ